MVVVPVPLDIFVLQLPSIVVIADDFELLEGICDWLLVVAVDDGVDVGVVNAVEVIVLVAAVELDVLLVVVEF